MDCPLERRETGIRAEIHPLPLTCHFPCSSILLLLRSLCPPHDWHVGKTNDAQIIRGTTIVPFDEIEER